MTRRTLVRLAVAFCVGYALSILWVGTTQANAGIDAGTNQLRAENGLKTLDTWDPLVSLANLRAAEITTNFNHPSDWGYLFARLPSCVTGIGENIAYHYDPVGDGEFVQMWWDSPEHQANMLGHWSHQGSATATAGGRTYAVQLFTSGCTAQTPRTTTTYPARKRAKPAAVKTTPTVQMPDTSVESPT